MSDNCQYCGASAPPMASFPIDMSIFTAELYHRELVRRYEQAKEKLFYQRESLRKFEDGAKNGSESYASFCVSYVVPTRIEIADTERILEELKARFPDMPGKELL